MSALANPIPLDQEEEGKPVAAEEPPLAGPSGIRAEERVGAWYTQFFSLEKASKSGTFAHSNIWAPSTERKKPKTN